jgi:hypothetical protein
VKRGTSRTDVALRDARNALLDMSTIRKLRISAVPVPLGLYNH